MLIVTNYAKTKTEPFFTTTAPLFEQDTLGNLSLEFTVNKTGNEAGFNLLQEESIVTSANYEFRVKQIIDDKPGRKTILAISTFFDLAYQFKDTTYGGTHTIQQKLSYLFNGTGWTATTDFSTTATIGKFGEKNIIHCVNQICEAFECEFEILPNYRVHFSKSLGPNNGAQYRYGHNIKVLSRKIDTTHLRTKITATGKEDLTVTYTSPNTSIWGVRVADTISDERFTNADNLLKKAKDSLIDYPEVSIELDTIELLDKQLGEKVWLIYEPIEGLEMQTRILKRTCVVDEVTDELKTIAVTLGNSLPRTMTDSELDDEAELADVKEEIKETIDEAKQEYRSKIEQTDERITLEVDHLNTSIAAIDIKADNINISVNNRITNEIAAVNVRANAIELSVSNLETNTNSRISVMQENINLKVDKNGSITDINLTPGTATINASKINLVGAVNVLSDITGNLGTITSGNINIQQDVYVGSGIYMRGSGPRMGVYFDGPWPSQIFDDRSGNLTVEGGTHLNLTGTNINVQGYKINMFGDVDFYGNVSGLVGSGTPGLSLAYSSASTRLYVRINGSNVGYVTLD